MIWSTVTARLRGEWGGGEEKNNQTCQSVSVHVEVNPQVRQNREKGRQSGDNRNATTRYHK